MSTEARPRRPDQVTVYRLDHLMFVFGVIVPLNMVIWTFIGAVIRFFGWFGDAGFYIGTMGFAATQLIVGIRGIVVLFRGNVNNGKGGKLR